MIKLNGKALDVTLFPDNTSQVWKLFQPLLDDTNYAKVTWEYSHEGEFMQLAQLKDLLDHHNFKTDLSITYLPYARQDKEIANDATFALRTFSRLLNSLSFNRVFIRDPHSKVAVNLIEGATPSYPTDIVNEVFRITETDAVCYPDAGALEKYAKMYKHKYFYGEKDRDQLTGWINGYKLKGNPRGLNILIIDDICDGGMTFNLLTKQLLEAGAKEVNLFVTHGLFSKGLRCLKEAGINRIFTADGEASEVQNNIAYTKI